MADIFPGKALLWGRIAVFLLCASCFCRGVEIQAAQTMVPPALNAPSMSLLPSLDYFIDETGTMDVEEAAAPENAAAFRPLRLKDLPRESGVAWLRFILAPLPAGERPATMLLDMGESVPGEPVLYEPVQNSLSGAPEWRETSPAQRNVLLLPEAGKEALTCYIRLDGLPGLWFSPMLRTPQDAATNWGSLARTAAMLALGVVMLLCLLRGLSEKGQWRIWTALYVGVALAQGLIGMPAYGSGHVSLNEALGVLAPGLALMLLPHVGRHLMHTRSRSRALDIQLLLLSLPGAVLALLPLLPGFAWLIRYLNLWPLGTLLFVPSALGAWIMGLGGAKRFLLGCLLPPLFVAAGILGLDSGYAANLLASAPLWGTALSALIIAATRAPHGDSAENEADDTTGNDTRVKNHAEPKTEDAVLSLDQPLDDPNLRLIAAMPCGASTPGREETDLAPASSHASDSTAPLASGPLSGLLPGLLEDALRLPLDRLLREGAALSHCALPPAVRQYAENMLDAAQDMSKILSDPNQLHQEQGGSEPRAPFNLQHLMREVHDTVAPAAESAGIGLAWYMPPHLGHRYEGEAKALSDTLCLLLESAVRATRHGAVHFSVRRVPESADAGHLLFTVTDTGSGMPPQNRSSLALTRAWELAGAHKGFLGVECTPHGTTIAFTLHLGYLEQDNAVEPEESRGSQPHVIIAAEEAAERQLLARMLETLPCRSSQVRNLSEALELNARQPALLLIIQAPSGGPAVADALLRFQEKAVAAGQPYCKFLAITKDDSGWDALADAGFTHALLEPVNSEAFCHTVREILDEAASAAPERLLSEPFNSPESHAEGFKSTPGEGAFAPQAAATPLEKPETQAGRPPLPDLFGSESCGDNGASLKIPDLTALPDLLSFAESLRGPLNAASGPSPSTPLGGLFSDLPAAGSLPDMDLPLPSTSGGDLRETPAHAQESEQDPVFQGLILPGLFVNPYAPDDTASGAAAALAKNEAKDRHSARQDLRPLTMESTEVSASVQAEFSAVAGLEGPIWTEEGRQSQNPESSEVPGGKETGPGKEIERETTAAIPVSVDKEAAHATPDEILDTAQGPHNPPAAFQPSPGLADHGAEEATKQTPCRSPLTASSPSVAASLIAAPETSKARPDDAAAATAAESPEPPAQAGPKTASSTPKGPLFSAPESETPPKPAPRISFKMSAQPTRASSSREYTSPSLSTPGEWVGEPMPIGSSLPTVASGPQTPEKAPPPQTAARKPLGFAARAPKPAPRVAFSVSPKPARPASAEGYVSPSLSTPGEWVGEPMPMPPKNKPAASDPASREPHAADAKEPATANLGTEISAGLTGAQLVMGRVVGATAAVQPSADRSEALASETPAQAAGAALTDPSGNAEQSDVPLISRAHAAGNGDRSSFMDFIAGAAPVEGAAALSHDPLADSPPQSLNQPEPAPVSEPQASSSAARPEAVSHSDAGESAYPPQAMDNAIALLVERLDAALQDAQKGFQSRRGIVVGEAAGRIAAESESYGFRVLARMARCVERAAKADDLNALKDLLPELAVAVERNRIALTPRK